MIRRMNINQSVKVTNDLLFLFFSQYSLISVDQWRLTQTETQLNDHRLSPRTLSLLPSFINLNWTNLSAQFSEAEEEEEEVIKHSPFRRSATEQTSEVKRRTDRIVQAAAALHLFCPQPFFFKKTKKKQLDLISLRCSLSCWAVNHTLMSPVELTDLTDTCLTVWRPRCEFLFIPPSCCSDIFLLCERRGATHPAGLKAAVSDTETSHQAPDIMWWWRGNWEILSCSIIYIFVHNASWFFSKLLNIKLLRIF